MSASDTSARGSAGRQPTVFDPMHPPINRRIADGLGVIDVRISGATGTRTFSALSLIMNAHLTWAISDSGAISSIDPAIGDASAQFRCGITGEPGFLYETEDVTLQIAAGPLHRMIFGALRPGEFRALLRRYGAFFEIHDDFYAPDTGLCLQARGPYDETGRLKVKKRRIGRKR